MHSARGFVLAGGRSTRMGRDKALLPFNGKAMVAHAVDTLLPICGTASIVGRRPDLGDFAPVIEDVFPDQGPIGGIHAALCASNEILNVFIPVDLPRLPGELLAYMLHRAKVTGALATLPSVNGMVQPLVAVLDRRLSNDLEESIRGGELKVTRVLENAVRASHGFVDVFRVEMVAQGGRFRAASAWRWFRNVNTPADLQAV